MQKSVSELKRPDTGSTGPVKVLALVTYNEDEALALAQYLAITEPLLKRNGAKIIERYLLEDEIVGTRPAKAVIIVEYPDRKAVDAVFSSREYESAKPFRDAAFATYTISIAE